MTGRTLGYKVEKSPSSKSLTLLGTENRPRLRNLTSTLGLEIATHTSFRYNRKGPIERLQ